MSKDKINYGILTGEINPSSVSFSGTGDTVRNKRIDTSMNEVIDSLSKLDSSRFDHSFNTSKGLSEKEEIETYNPDYSPEGIYRSFELDYNGYDSKEDKSQSPWSKIGNSLARLVPGIAIDTAKAGATLIDYFIEGLTYYPEKFFTNATKEELSKHDIHKHTNFIIEYLNKSKEDLNEYFKVERDNPDKTFDFSDIAWYIQGIEGAMSSLSYMALGMGVGKSMQGIGYVGKKVSNNLKNFTGNNNFTIDPNRLSGFDRAARAFNRSLGANASGNDIKSLIKESTYSGIQGLSSRIVESGEQSREVYESTYDLAINKLNEFNDVEYLDFINRNPEYKDKSKEEVAELIASQASIDNFNTGMWLLGLDAFQFMFMNERLKPFKKDKDIIRYNDDKIKSINNDYKGYKDTYLDKIKKGISTLGNLELGEGVEEAIQYYAEQSSKDKAKNKLDKNHYIRTIGDYLTDSHMWEAAFMGSIGGIFMNATTKVGEIINKDKRRNNLIKAGFDEEYVDKLLSLSNDNKEIEIQKRVDYLKSVSDAIIDIDNDRDIFNVTTDENGNNIYGSFKDDDAKSEAKRKVVKQFATEMALNAASVGNYDLLVEYLKNIDYSHFNLDKEIEGEFTEDNKIKDYMLNTIQDTYNIYSKYASELTRHLNLPDVHLAHMYATDLTKRALHIKSLEDTLQSLDNIVENDKNSGDITQEEYKVRRQKFDDASEFYSIYFAKKELDELIDKQEKIKQEFLNKVYSSEYYSSQNEELERQINKVSNFIKNFILDFNHKDGKYDDNNIDDFDNISKENLFKRIEETINNLENKIDADYFSKDELKIISSREHIKRHVSYLKSTMPIDNKDYIREYTLAGLKYNNNIKSKFKSAADVIVKGIKKLADKNNITEKEVYDKVIESSFTNLYEDPDYGIFDENLFEAVKMLEIGNDDTKEYINYIEKRIEELTDKRLGANRSNSTGGRTSSSTNLSNENVSRVQAKNQIEDKLEQENIDESKQNDIEPFTRPTVGDNTSNENNILETIDEQQNQNINSDNTSFKEENDNENSVDVNSTNEVNNSVSKPIIQNDGSIIIKPNTEEYSESKIIRQQVQDEIIEIIGSIDAVQLTDDEVVGRGEYFTVNSKKVFDDALAKYLSDNDGGNTEIQDFINATSNNERKNILANLKNKVLIYYNTRLGDLASFNKIFEERLVPTLIAMSNKNGGNSTWEDLAIAIEGYANKGGVFSIISEDGDAEVDKLITKYIKELIYQDGDDEVIKRLNKAEKQIFEGKKRINRVSINAILLIDKILTDKNIEYDKAILIFNRLRGYQNRKVGHPFNITGLKELNNIYNKNPDEFYERLNILHNKIKVDNETDTHFSISGINVDTNQKLKSGESVIITPTVGKIHKAGYEAYNFNEVNKSSSLITPYTVLIDNNTVTGSWRASLGLPISMSIRNERGIEIGYLGTIQTSTDNNRMRILNRSKGFDWIITKNGSSSKTNYDDLFLALFDDTDDGDDNKTYNINGNAVSANQIRDMRDLINNINAAITDEEVFNLIKEYIANSGIIKNNKYNIDNIFGLLLNNGNIDINPNIEFVYRASSTTLEGSVSELIKSISDIANFRDKYFSSQYESYIHWKDKIRSNYETTLKFQKALIEQYNKANKTKNGLVKSDTPIFIKSKIDAVQSFTDINESLYETVHGKDINPSHLIDDSRLLFAISDTELVDILGNRVTYDKNFVKGSIFIMSDEDRPSLIKNEDTIDNNLKNEIIDDVANYLSSLSGSGVSLDSFASYFRNLFEGKTDDNKNGVRLFKNVYVIQTDKTVCIKIQDKNGNRIPLIYYTPSGDIYYNSNKHIDVGPYSKDVKAITKQNISAYAKNIAEQMCNNLSINISFSPMKRVKNQELGNNKIKYDKDGRLIINVNGKVFNYNGYADFISKHGNIYISKPIVKKGGIPISDIIYVSLQTELISSDGSEVKRTPTEIIKSKKIGDILETKELIISSGKDSKELDEIYKLEKELGVDIIPKTVTIGKFKNNAFASYDPKTDIITLSNSANINNRTEYIRVLLHEQFHKNVRKNITEEQKQKLLKETLKLFKEFKEKVDNYKGTVDNTFNQAKTVLSQLENYYGNNENLLAEEFLMEIFTNNNVRNTANSIISLSEDADIFRENKTILDKIVELLLKFFGIDKNNINKKSILAKQMEIIANLNNDDKSDKNDNIKKPVEGGDVEIESVHISDDFLSNKKDINSNDTSGDENDIDTDSPYNFYDEIGVDVSDSSTSSEEDLPFSIIPTDGIIINENVTRDEITLSAYSEIIDDIDIGVITTQDMNEFEHSFPMGTRAAVARSLASMKLKFACK